MLTSVGIISYASATIAFLLLSALLVTSWRGRLHGIALTISCLIAMIWAGAISIQLASEYPLPILTDILEILRSGCWSFFLILLLYPKTKINDMTNKSLSVPLATALFYILLLAATIYLYVVHEENETIVFTVSLVGRVAVALLGMILVEQLYRNTLVKGRWAIKYLCLGVGGIFAFDFYLYSDAMLFRHINPDIWAARGIVNALTVPLIAVSAARNSEWSLGISVSRRILFHSAALFGAAIYYW